MELKFIRGTTTTSKRDVTTVRKDFTNVMRIRERLENPPYAYFIVFTKGARPSPTFEVLAREIDAQADMQLVFETAQ